MHSALTHILYKKAFRVKVFTIIKKISISGPTTPNASLVLLPPSYSGLANQWLQRQQGFFLLCGLSCYKVLTHGPWVMVLTDWVKCPPLGQYNCFPPAPQLLLTNSDLYFLFYVAIHEMFKRWNMVSYLKHDLFYPWSFVGNLWLSSKLLSKYVFPLSCITLCDTR